MCVCSLPLQLQLSLSFFFLDAVQFPFCEMLFWLKEEEMSHQELTQRLATVITHVGKGSFSLPPPLLCRYLGSHPFTPSTACNTAQSCVTPPCLWGRSEPPVTCKNQKKQNPSWFTVSESSQWVGFSFQPTVLCYNKNEPALLRIDLQ